MTIFEQSQPGQHAYSMPKEFPEFVRYQPSQELIRKTAIPLPEISELDLTRHFSQLAQRNMGIDTNFYPLGSCTMKLNPRINEWSAQLPAFTRTHPLAPDDTVQGSLQIIDELLTFLCELTGTSAGSLAPNAGAQGEYVGLRMISAYHKKKGDLQRTEILIPDSAHGTNPATATLAGLTTVPLKTDVNGDIDLEQLRHVASERTAGLMLTNPNTLGLFSPVIARVTEIVHSNGGLLYYDGANLNAIMQLCRPGDMGFDVMHLNLHKTFSTPHGGGGPGSGPVLCNALLEPFLPIPRVVKNGEKYYLSRNFPDSIGQISTFYGNFSIYLRAYLYAILHGKYGLRKVSEQAVLNANYLKKKLEPYFKVPYKQYCMHEFVLQADRYLDQKVRALDIAKRLLDYGVHAPTIYFPLIVRECMLIEPTETESKRTLDRFVEIMAQIISEINSDPNTVRTAPHSLSVGRLDEVLAAKKPRLSASFE